MSSSLASCTDAKLDNVDDSESVASDESEEMIEVDEDEFDQRRSVCVSNMKELEYLFSKLKEALISEKKKLIDQKLKEIEDETAEEFTIPLQKLEQNRDVKIKLATLLKEYRLKNLENIYQYEEKSTKQSFDNDIQILFDKHVSRIQQEIEQLEEKRRQFILDYNLYQLSINGMVDEQQEKTDNKHLAESESNSSELLNKPSTVTYTNTSATFSPLLFPGAPYVVYSLQDSDIMEDWSIIKMHNNLRKNNNFSMENS